MLSPFSESTNNRQQNHSDWIDAFRGLAAMWVILYHSREQWVGFYQIRSTPEAYSVFDRLLAWISLPTACGGSAVMLFFLISGFCVHLPYAAESRAFVATQYALRRTFRILPPYLFAVALTCLLEWLVYWMHGAAPTPWSRVFRVAMLSQNYGSRDYGNHDGQLLTNGSLWSLPIEVELYVAYLVFYFLLKKTTALSTGIIVSVVSLLATIGYLCGLEELSDNFLRFWAMWCAGALLAECSKRGQLSEFRTWNLWILLLIAVSAAVGVSRHWPEGILEYLWAAVYFHLIWFALLKPGSINLLPKWCVWLLVWMGTVSYSAYLIHKPIFALYGYVWQHFTGGKPASFLVPLLYSLSIWPLAWLFWKGCEFPFHEISRRLGKVRKKSESILPNSVKAV